MKNAIIVILIYFSTPLCFMGDSCFCSWHICLTEYYPKNYQLSTFYHEDGRVEGRKDGGPKDWSYFCEDTAPKHLIDTISILRQIIINKFPKDIIDTQNVYPYYELWITNVKAHKIFQYKTTICSGFKEIEIGKLAGLVHRNQCDFSGKKNWGIDYTSISYDSLNKLNCLNELKKKMKEIHNPKPIESNEIDSKKLELLKKLQELENGGK